MVKGSVLLKQIATWFIIPALAFKPFDYAASMSVHSTPSAVLLGIVGNRSIALNRESQNGSY